MNAEEIKKSLEGKGAVMEVGSPNDGFAKFFTGKSWLASLSKDKDIPVYNVTFENGAHTHWHIHHGTSQVLIVESGKGYLQYEGKEPQVLRPGDVVTIPPEVKHWHGAAPGCNFQHISLSKEGEGVSNEWLEAVDEKEFEKL
ncbi:cupin domain-containing protein [uncultured Dialister sp.]|jgi:quercetin dioxygenase-like cupin family protein|uniref:cupin domain-containing protein n=1 Tax=uncultured Dialister sp. TaxID=278064 RepID=UPI0026296999|nr:cupin domain-containing protein [uncultured Dialister sp.]